ncbi:MAG: T9SS type A sorting domain-containing protein [Bacteroidetes bacterium]|nr:T9SS type A sorting domain-containing protein [Bacteroidota bacterium]
MIKPIIGLLFLLMIQLAAFSQSCLPEGISFWSQAEIDLFQYNYPNCTEIEGNVMINGMNSDFDNLDGLNVITTIGGDLKIWNQNSLPSLRGLEQLTSIGGDIDIAGSLQMLNIDALIQLTYIGGDLEIRGCNALSSLSGLDNISFVGGSIKITSNPVLSSFEQGLSKITVVHGSLYIGDNFSGGNDLLTDVSSLKEVTSINGYLWVEDNASLTNLYGLHNLQNIGEGICIKQNAALSEISSLENVTTIGAGIWVYQNPSLSSLSGFIGITSIPGRLDIQDNASLQDLSGLDNVSYVDSDIVIVNNNGLKHLFGLENITAGNYMFFSINGNNSLQSLSGLDNLSTIEGTLTIEGNDSLLSLAALGKLTHIGGSLSIEDNFSLTTLTGLDSVNYIGYNLYIKGNASLLNLSGLGNIVSLDGYLIIGSPQDGDGNISLVDLSGMDKIYFVDVLTIGGNSSLKTLHGLENLSRVVSFAEIKHNASLKDLNGLDNLHLNNANLYIEYNDSLTDISGIAHINGASLNHLRIWHNDALSECAVKSVCDFLEDNNATIQYNASGCNSQLEVELACSGLDDQCLEDGFRFNTQELIDDFHINHPNCSEIGGDVIIEGVGIKNLLGLSPLTTIKGSFDIYGNVSIDSLTGLNNITTIEGGLGIYTAGGITDLSGLSSLVSVGENLGILSTEHLSSLTGLENLVSVGGGIQIFKNKVLQNIRGLKNVTSIGGHLLVNYNPIINSLEGLDNLPASSIERLRINDNPLLSYCEVQSVCEYLIKPEADIVIEYNSMPCNSIATVLSACGGMSFECLPEGIIFSNQDEINQFQDLYPTCNRIKGNTTISGPDIYDLSALSGLTSLGNDLIILANDELLTLGGLENLRFIHGDLVIGDNQNGGNPSLNSLMALTNLYSVAGDIYIQNNNALDNLSGLGQLIADSVNNIYINNNPLLSVCDVQSVCDFLENPVGTIEIVNNHPGCNTNSEVMAECANSIPMALNEPNISVYPNPATTKITISSMDKMTIDEVIIYNTLGKKIYFANHPEERIDISMLTSGIYTIEAVSGIRRLREKLIIF